MLGPDTFLNERYRLIAPVGEGGMATVYSAQDVRLGRTVAVKVLHPEYARDQPFLQRFQQEAEFSASLGSHPNIVAIYDVGEDGAYRYIVMELVEGRPLKDLILERAPFAVDEALSIGRQVALALDFAHGRGLVHRDVKPQNIMVTPGGTAKVTDFGIALGLTASQLTRTGMVIGTVHYFSPEQAQGKPVTPASDIYSLGVILYEMLTGRLPFEAENAVGVALQHINAVPPPIRDLNPAVPAAVVSIVMRALEKDPEQRYRNAGEFAAALTNLPPVPFVGGTTTLNPLPAQPPERRVRRPIVPPEEPITRRYVAREPVVTRPVRPELPVNRWRTAWITLGLLFLAAAVAIASFFIANHAFGGASVASPTPTATATPGPTVQPTKKPRKRAAPTPTIAVVVSTVAPTATYVLPTDTATAIPITDTPVPPTPAPTDTAAPPTETPTPALPTATPTPAGPTATATPIG